MQEQYHGWDELEDQKGFYQFADVLGQKRGESTFVITGFGNTPGRREAISAMMAASKQFRCKLHIRKNESTDRLLNELIKASMIKVALVQKGEFQEYGVLGMSATPPPPTKPWWKFW
ncbi:hypothetical protein Pla52o_52220 [Novipirellula galeiformis]|uniref:Uncharacterized protein n=1 Tax=Novipirellula galeiformis TaxID=2528004 RepID=A0A5C6BZW7_9BACT|nr:hypothetical protein [Novipirellula galeiformis]TWU17418.1 hypothetical protein Pla52o_52220 [Novipirellula galeiformis]